jgi:hypothetical protein
MGLVFALFTAAYILGAWTAFLIVRQPQGQYEEGMPVWVSSGAVITIGGSREPAGRR